MQSLEDQDIIELSEPEPRTGVDRNNERKPGRRGATSNALSSYLLDKLRILTMIGKKKLFVRGRVCRNG